MKRNFIALFCILLSSCSFAQKSFEQKVDELLEEPIRRNRYHGSLLVMQQDQIVMAKGYGYANPEHNLKNQIDTVFRIGSVTKQFTAMAIMILEERGELTLDDRVGSYFPDYKNAKNITIKQLLTHSSGITNYTELPFYLEIIRLPQEKKGLIERLHSFPLLFEPGETTSYSNSNYLLLTAIIEKTAQTSYEDFLKKEIFKKLKMNSTGIDNHLKLIPNRALGLSLNDQKLVPADFIDVSVANGAGAMYSTVHDLSIWYKAIRDHKLISPETTEEMLTPFKHGFASGWFVANRNGGKRVSHSGGINGFEAQISFYPETDSLVVVLSNIEHSVTGDITKKLEEGLLKDQFEPFEFLDEVPLNLEEAKRVLGTYILNADLQLKITLEEDKLYAQATNQSKVQVFQAGENSYFLSIIDAKIKFVFNEKNEVTQLVLNQSGQDSYWTKK